MTDFLRAVWRDVLGSLEGTAALIGGDGGFGVDLPALTVRALSALLIVLLAWLAYRVARAGLRWLLGRVRLGEVARGPLLLALRAIASLLAGLAVLGLFGVPRDLLSDLAGAASLAFLFYLVGWIGTRLLMAAVDRAGLDRSLRQLLRNVVVVAVAAVGFVTVMDQFGVNVLAAITALGVVGIAVGFAAQETLSNFIAGVTLLIERPFRIGDWVELDGETGRVDAIRLRTTLIVDRDNVHTIIPNAQVAAGRIVNLSGGGPLRIRIPIGIAYKASASVAREALLPVLRAHPDTLDGEGYDPAVAVTGLGASSVDLVALVWIAQDDIADQPRIAAQLTERAKEALDAAGVEIPFPHLQVFVDGAKGLVPVLEPWRPAAATAADASGPTTPNDA